MQSRYYDPVTHRFINVDGLVSTGTGILGHNMFAYCDNNPVNNLDYYGEKTVKTISEFQSDLTSGANSNYSIMDITKLQQQGYSNSDRVVLKNNGTFVNYNAGYKIWDSVVAVYNSVNLDVSCGIGFGAKVGIKELAEIGGVIKYDPFAFHGDIYGFKFGEKFACNASASVLGWDIVSIGGEDFRPYNTGELESSLETGGIGMSFGYYEGIGADCSFYWSYSYITNEWKTIW